MKALDFLKEQQRRHENMAESMNLVYFDDELEEAVSELEALQQHKSCEGCVREAEDMVDPHCAFCSRACKDNFEPKEK